MELQNYVCTLNANITYRNKSASACVTIKRKATFQINYSWRVIHSNSDVNLTLSCFYCNLEKLFLCPLQTH